MLPPRIVPRRPVVHRAAVLVLALFSGISGSCASTTAEPRAEPATETQAEPEIVRESAAPSIEHVTGIVLNRGHSPHSWKTSYRYSVYLTADGEAVWDGIHHESRPGRCVGSFDAAQFDALVGPLLASLPYQHALSGMEDRRYGFHAEWASIRVHLAQGRSVEVSDPSFRHERSPEYAIATYVDAIEAFAETIVWKSAR